MKVSFSKTNNDISLTPESSNEATTTNNEAEIDTSETAPPTPVEKMKKRMKVSLVRTFSEGSILGTYLFIYWYFSMQQPEANISHLNRLSKCIQKVLIETELQPSF